MKTLYDQTPEIIELVLQKKLRTKSPNPFKHLEKVEVLWTDGGQTFQKVTSIVYDYVIKNKNNESMQEAVHSISRAYFDFLKLVGQFERFETAEKLTKDFTKDQIFKIVLEALIKKDIHEKIKECGQIVDFIKDEHCKKLEIELQNELEKEEERYRKEKSLMELFQKTVGEKEHLVDYEEAKTIYVELSDKGYQNKEKPEGHQKAYILSNKQGITEERFVNENLFKETEIFWEQNYFPFKSTTRKELQTEIEKELANRFKHASTARMVYNFIADNLIGAIETHYEIVFVEAVKDLKKEHKRRTLDVIEKIAKGEYSHREIEVQGNTYNRDEFLNTYIKLTKTAVERNKGINITEIYNNEYNVELRKHMLILKVLNENDSKLTKKEIDYILLKSKYVENFPIEDEELLSRLIRNHRDQHSVLKILNAKYEYGDLFEKEAKMLVEKIAEKESNVYQKIFIGTKTNYSTNTKLVESLLEQVVINEDIFKNIEFNLLKEFLIKLTSNATKALDVLNEVKRKELMNIHYIFTEKVLPQYPNFDDKNYHELKSCIWAC